MATKRIRNSESGLKAAVREELLFLARDCAENIRDLKKVSRAVLASYTLAFVIVWNAHDAAPYALSALFIVGGFVTAVVCAFFFPDRLSEYHVRLGKIYERFGKTFKETYGNIADAGRNDVGDYMYMAFAFLYPLSLVATYIVHQWDQVLGP